MDAKQLISATELVSDFLGNDGAKLGEQVFFRYAWGAIEEINQQLIEEGLIQNAIVNFSKQWNTKLEYIKFFGHAPIITFTEDTSYSDKLLTLTEQLPAIKKQAIRTANLINKNRPLYERLFPDVLARLKKENALPNPDSLTFEFRDHNWDYDAFAHLTFSGRETLFYSVNLDLTIEPVGTHAEQVDHWVKKLTDHWYAQLEEYKAKQRRLIPDYLFHLLGRNSFTIAEDLPKNVNYDIPNKKISLYFNLQGRTLRKEFEEELESFRQKILCMEQQTELYGEPVHLDLCQRYYFRLREEKEVDGVQYRVYQYRGKHRKPLHKLFKDGIEVTGREKRRILKAHGFFKENLQRGSTPEVI